MQNLIKNTDENTNAKQNEKIIINFNIQENENDRKLHNLEASNN